MTFCSELVDTSSNIIAKLKLSGVGAHVLQMCQGADDSIPPCSGWFSGWVTQGGRLRVGCIG